MGNKDGCPVLKATDTQDREGLWYQFLFVYNMMDSISNINIV